MRITESTISRMVREELGLLDEARGEGPSPPYRHPMMSYVKPGVSEPERAFARLVRDLGPDEFSRMLVRAIGDSERASSIARFMQGG